MFVQKLKNYQVIRDIWAKLKSSELENDYIKRINYYNRLSKGSRLDKNLEVRLRKKHTERKIIGRIHTFAIIPQFSWHLTLLPDLRELGPVTLFDYISMGYGEDIIYNPRKWTTKRKALRKQITDKIIPEFERAYQKQPIDWVVCYGGGQEISNEALEYISEKYRVPIVNMSFDDKHGWCGDDCGGIRTGAIDITKNIDVFFTSSSVTCDWHILEGGYGLYMPEGFDKSTYFPLNVKKDIPVSFVGAAYGFRKSTIEFLKKNGIQVQAYGHGWENGYASSPNEIFNRSIINLGMGGIGYSEYLTNVKGRDFEVPGSGGGVYLTSYNPDLAKHFVDGKEILFYRNKFEILELIRYYLNNPDKAEIIAKNARHRSMQEHRWLHRYKFMAKTVGLL